MSKHQKSTRTDFGVTSIIRVNGVKENDGASRSLLLTWLCRFDIPTFLLQKILSKCVIRL